MEKIKPVLLWLLHNRFWVTCVLVAAVSLVTWFMAWQAIEGQRADQERKIKGKHSSIKAVLDTTAKTNSEDVVVDAHPNKGTQDQMDDQINAAAEAALVAWRVRYDQQKDVLKFTEEIPEHIRSVLEKHQPMEMPLDKELMEQTFRDTYREFIVGRMPALSRDTVGATWQWDEKGKKLPENNVAFDAEGKASLKPKKEDLVRWGKANQDLWHSKVTEFSGFDGNKSDGDIPTSEQMLALQQDLWVLEAMLKIIATVNEGYAANDLAPIERLDHVLVGKDAMEATESSPSVISGVTIKTDLQKGGATNNSQFFNKPRGKRSAAEAAEGGGNFTRSQSKSPFHGRYVDRDYRRLNKSEIVNVLTATSLSDRSYLGVAKRIPVRVGVRMDERKINDFIAAASNSPFTFEIRQVRINRHVPNAGVKREGSAGGGSDDSGPTMATGGGQGGGGGGVGAMRDGAGGAGGSGDGDDGPFVPEARKSFDVDVEFNGIMKIYNPPNRALFFPNETTGSDPGAPTGTGAPANTTASK